MMFHSPIIPLFHSATALDWIRTRPELSWFSHRLSFALALCFTGTLCVEVSANEPIARRPENVSFRHEVEIAVNKALTWLKSQQQPDGSWSMAEYPALTGLPLIAFQRAPDETYLKTPPEFLRKAYAFLRSNAKPDGGIYAQGLSNYNTSIALMALLNSGDPADEPLITRARDFVLAQQASGMVNPALDGGIGSGPTGVSPKRQHPDLDNTVIALEALRAFKAQRPNRERPGEKELNWQAAIEFVARCQNLPGSNPEPWFSG